jgi:hypothetical protein
MIFLINVLISANDGMHERKIAEIYSNGFEIFEKYCIPMRKKHRKMAREKIPILLILKHQINI